jgi:hypothetical protein
MLAKSARASFARSATVRPRASCKSRSARDCIKQIYHTKTPNNSTEFGRDAGSTTTAPATASLRPTASVLRSSKIEFTIQRKGFQVAFKKQPRWGFFPVPTGTGRRADGTDLPHRFPALWAKYAKPSPG